MEISEMTGKQEISYGLRQANEKLQKMSTLLMEMYWESIFNPDDFQRKANAFKAYQEELELFSEFLTEDAVSVLKDNKVR